MTRPTYDRDFWEQLWSQTLSEPSEHIARRPPNLHLTTEVEHLRPGRALDAGCGHGSGTLWLATHGWQVTAVDFSEAALAHGRSRAEAAGANIAERIPGSRPIPSFYRRGFRVPALLVSPFAKRHHVEHQVFDHTSVLRLIEWRWGLSPLTVRDATANNLADALQLDKKPKPDATTYDVPPFVSAGCTPSSAAAPTAAPPLGRTTLAAKEWAGLAEVAEQYGYELG